VIDALKQDSSFDGTKGYVTVGECQKLTGLNAFNKGITSIKGIEYCTGLEWLYLGGNQITDISPLLGLKNLTWLFLASTGINDGNISNNVVPVLKQLSNLTALDLSHNNIKDISALKELINLRRLNLSYNNIVDISALEYLTNLTLLDLGYNKIENISALISNTGLDSNATVWLTGNFNITQEQINDLRKKGVTVCYNDTCSTDQTPTNSPYPWINGLITKSMQHIPTLKKVKTLLKIQ